MKNRLLGFAALGFLLIAFVLAVAPAVRAGGVDDKIQALENELNQLKSQQMELKKDATAAAAAMPTFSYRPGNGLMIQDADKYWSIRFGIESHFRSDFEAGRADAGRTDGEVLGRRFRPYIWYCIANCLTEIEVGWDMDGYGTGNGKNSTNTAGSSVMQRGEIYFHFEQMNPWLPTLQLGMDLTGIGVMPYRQNLGSSTGPFQEYDLLSRNNGFNTGRAGTGYTLTWNSLPLSGIGIPGRAKFQYAMASIGEGDDGLSSFKDIGHNHNIGVQIEPFTQLQNKWLSGFGYSFNAWFCNSQKPNANVTPGPDNGSCNRNRVQDDGDSARQTLFDGQARDGKGTSVFVAPGIGWKVGPYDFAAFMGFMRWSATGKDTGATSDGTGNGLGVGQGARNFRIMHSLWLWSPKGLVTGSADTPGSVQAAFAFERGDWWCGHDHNAANANAPCAAGSQFSRERVLVREWDLWYFLNPRNSIGVGWQWFDASNLRTGFGQAGSNLHVIDPRSTTSLGKGGDWVDVMLNWRYWF